MSPTVQRIIALFLFTGGLLATIGYGVALLLMDSRRDAADQWGAVAGFALFVAVVSFLWLLATFRMGRSSEATFSVPPLWLTLILLVGVVGTGFVLNALDRAVYLGPVFTVVGFTLVGAIFLRIAARWMPERRISFDNVVLPGAFGVFVAPAVLMLIQGVAVVLLLAGVIAGLFIDNPDFAIDPHIEQRISDYIEEQGSSAMGTELPEIVESPTVALSLFSLVAVIAPFIEELVKAVGAILILSRRSVVSLGDVLLAAVASSLGFALFEGVGYTLGGGAAWHQVLAIRAPVVVMHVAATTIIVFGWYRMRSKGRGFIPYFVAGTALHAGWNALYVGFLYSLTGVEAGAEPSALQALGVLVMMMLIGSLFVAGFGWLLFAAREGGLSERRSTLAAESIDRLQPSYASIPGSG